MILDRDARLQEFVDDAEQQSPRPLHIWRRDAIESYLIVPSAMTRLVVKKRVDLSVDEVVAFIEEARDEVIDDLRDETFDRVSNRYRRDVIARDGRNVEPSEANKRAREVLEDREQLTRLTRGKDLLASLKKKIQDQYRVSFGNQAIVSEISAEEIDSELIEVLDQIESLSNE